MKDYQIIYIKKDGDRQVCNVTANDVRDSIKVALEQHTDAQRIISSIPNDVQTTN